MAFSVIFQFSNQAVCPSPLFNALVFWPPSVARATSFIPRLPPLSFALPPLTWWQIGFNCKHAVLAPRNSNFLPYWSQESSIFPPTDCEGIIKSLDCSMLLQFHSFILKLKVIIPLHCGLTADSYAGVRMPRKWFRSRHEVTRGWHIFPGIFLVQNSEKAMHIGQP